MYRMPGAHPRFSSYMVFTLEAPLKPFSRRSVILLLSKYKSSRELMLLMNDGTSVMALSFKMLAEEQEGQKESSRRVYQ